MDIQENLPFSLVLKKVARRFQNGDGTSISPRLNGFLAFDCTVVDLTLDALNVYIRHGSNLGIFNMQEREFKFEQIRYFCLSKNSSISMNIINEMFRRMEIEPINTVRQILIFGGGGNSPLDRYKAGGSSIQYINHVLTNVLEIPYECVYTQLAQKQGFVTIQTTRWK